MTHRDFYKVVHRDLKSAKITVRQSDSDVIISTVFNALTDVLAQGHNVEITNFGSFRLHLRKMRDIGRKKTIKRWAVSFSSSRNFSTKLNRQFSDEED